jgi:hypothetical protein
MWSASVRNFKVYCRSTFESNSSSYTFFTHRFTPSENYSWHKHFTEWLIFYFAGIGLSMRFISLCYVHTPIAVEATFSWSSAFWQTFTKITFHLKHYPHIRSTRNYGTILQCDRRVDDALFVACTHSEHGHVPIEAQSWPALATLQQYVEYKRCTHAYVFTYTIIDIL